MIERCTVRDSLVTNTPNLSSFHSLPANTNIPQIDGTVNLVRDAQVSFLDTSDPADMNNSVWNFDQASLKEIFDDDRGASQQETDTTNANRVSQETDIQQYYRV